MRTSLAQNCYNQSPEEMPMANGAPEAPEQPLVPAPPAPQIPIVLRNTSVEGAPTAATSGRRSFRDIRRQLTEDELTQPGVQKLLIEDFERAEAECETLRSFVEKFHDADKQIGVLQEKLKTEKALEIATGVGLAGGGSIVSLAPSIWAINTFAGIAAVVVGVLFVGGAIATKVVQRSK
jgi:hypothetical protein